jgi:hypothetical protein
MFIWGAASRMGMIAKSEAIAIMNDFAVLHSKSLSCRIILLSQCTAANPPVLKAPDSQNSLLHKVLLTKNQAAWLMDCRISDAR